MNQYISEGKNHSSGTGTNLKLRQCTEIVYRSRRHRTSQGTIRDRATDLVPSQSRSTTEGSKGQTNYHTPVEQGTIRAMVSTHIRVPQPNYNKKGKLSGLMTPASTCSMLLPQHQKLVLKTARQLDQNLTDTTRDLRCHRIKVHGVDLSQYGQEGEMELIQDEILHGSYNIQLT